MDIKDQIINAEIFDLADTIADRHDLDRLLVRAIIRVESGGNPFAVRYEPNWKYFYKVDEFAKALHITGSTEYVFQATSWGCMQVIGSVCRELGFKDYLQKLSDPVTGILYGCKKLQSVKRQYEHVEDQIAAYNAGTARKDARGVYSNQAYVDKVFMQLNGLKLGSNS